MNNYLGKIDLSDLKKDYSTGMLGEIAFARWFTKTYEGDKIHKQNAERDFQGIDFADEKGFTYQIKATASKTYTFNCVLDDLNWHLRANWYVCIQIHETIAYIEAIYDRKEILNEARQSYKYDGTCFIWAKDLLQYKLEL